MDQVNNFINSTMKGFDNWMINPYFATVITIVLTVYASLASPNLPSYIKKLFDNSLFKILIITFIAYRANSNPQLSLLIAICFVITLNFLAEKETKEAFAQIETFGQLEHFSNALDMNSGIEPFVVSSPTAVPATSATSAVQADKTSSDSSASSSPSTSSSTSSSVSSASKSASASESASESELESKPESDLESDLDADLEPEPVLPSELDLESDYSSSY